MDYGAVLPPSLMVFSLYCQGLFGDIGNGRIFAWWLVSLPNNIITLHPNTGTHPHEFRKVLKKPGFVVTNVLWKQSQDVAVNILVNRGT